MLLNSPLRYRGWCSGVDGGMAALDIRLLGGFEARLATGEPLALKGRKAQALLARLALAPGTPCGRESLTALLWSDRGEEQARGSLRQALAELRRSFNDTGLAPLVVGRDTVGLDAKAVAVDVATFERAVSEGTAEALARATELYAGPLLDGFPGIDPAFEEWLREERMRLADLARDALTRLLANRTTAGETAAAIAMARRLLALDPLQESVHRALMELYAGTGERTLALKQFQACSDVLRAELGVEPDAATRRLHDRIRQAQETDGDESEPSAPKEERRRLPLPDKPSIAVLPLVNMSGDAEQEYFADGITEDIITELSRFGELFVIARNSCFAYKGRAVKVQEIGRDLGVQYVVEGSLRKAGSRVRVTVQLVEAASGNHVWAERYDRQVEDIFAVQDEVVQTIVATLFGRIEHYDAERVRRGQTPNLRAYDYLIQGRQQYYRFDRDSNIKARELFEKAIAQDPEYGNAIAGLAETHWTDWWAGWIESADLSLKHFVEIAQRLFALDDNSYPAQSLIAWVHLIHRDFDRARLHFERAAAVNPCNSDLRMELGLFAMFEGRHEDAIARVREASRLNPFGRYNYALGMILYCARRYDEAITGFRATRAGFPQVHAWLAAAYAQMGKHEHARKAAATYVEVVRADMKMAETQTDGGWSGFFAERFPFRERSDLDHLLDGLAKAGLA